MKKQGALLMGLLLCCITVLAQEKRLVREGNQLYQQKKFKEAAAAYQQALQKNPAYVPGSFNLGNSLIQQNQLEAARKVMTATAKNAKAKEEQSGANYNIGNTYMQEQKWAEAVDAYKKALRKNPQDADAKYNLSYALAKMKQNQNGGGGKDKNKDNKDKNDKNKDDKNKDKDKKDQQDKNKQDQQDQKDQQQDKNQGNGKEDQKDQQRPEPQPSKLTQQQADNLLKALQQDERKLQDKVQKGKGVPVKMEKDW